MQKLVIFESSNIQNPSIIASQQILRTLTKIGKPCLTLEIQNFGILKIFIQIGCFAEMVKSYNYFSKSLYLRCLTGFWVRPSLNKYSLTCRVNSRDVLHETYTESWHIPDPVYYRKFRHIQSYLAVLWHIYNSALLRILAYLEQEICSEFCQGIFWHIQNAL